MLVLAALLALANAAPPARRDARAVGRAHRPRFSGGGRPDGGRRGARGVQRAVRAGARPLRRLLPLGAGPGAAPCSPGAGGLRPAGAGCVQRAHARGLQVHAWINVLLCAPSAQPLPAGAPPAPPSGLRDGRRDDGRRRRRRALPVAVVAGRAPHLEAVVRELVRGYRVDGLHLDYIRYPGPDYDYSPAALARSRATRSWRACGRRRRERVPQAWAQYRRDALTALAGRLARAARAERPGLRRVRGRGGGRGAGRAPEVPGLAVVARPAGCSTPSARWPTPRTRRCSSGSSRSASGARGARTGVGRHRRLPPVGARHRRPHRGGAGGGRGRRDGLLARVAPAHDVAELRARVFARGRRRRRVPAASPSPPGAARGEARPDGPSYSHGGAGRGLPAAVPVTAPASPPSRHAAAALERGARDAREDAPRIARRADDRGARLGAVPASGHA